MRNSLSFLPCDSAACTLSAMQSARATLSILMGVILGIVSGTIILESDRVTISSERGMATSMPTTALPASAPSCTLCHESSLPQCGTPLAEGEPCNQSIACKSPSWPQECCMITAMMSQCSPGLVCDEVCKDPCEVGHFADLEYCEDLDVKFLNEGDYCSKMPPEIPWTPCKDRVDGLTLCTEMMRPHECKATLECRDGVCLYPQQCCDAATDRCVDI